MTDERFLEHLADDSRNRLTLRDRERLCAMADRVRQLKALAVVFNTEPQGTTREVPS